MKTVLTASVETKHNKNCAVRTVYIKRHAHRNALINHPNPMGVLTTLP